MPTHIEVPQGALSREALEGLVDEFVTREGTDYGEREHSPDEKRASVRAKLASGQVLIVFDMETESVALALAEQLAVR